MNTAERASALAQTAGHFPILGRYETEDLIDLVRLELGHSEILDGFRPYATHFSQATPRSPILHIVSGNTPHAALQSLVRGLLLGARNLVKLPSAGLPEVDAFVQFLPDNLRTLVEVSRELPPSWLKEAQAWIVFGSDETISSFRSRLPGGVIFEPHGHRFSLAMIFDSSLPSEDLAAADISEFNQKGCLSPHDIYVSGDARSYAERLAQAMDRYATIHRPDPITQAEAAEIHDMRANYRFRAASDPRVQIWESAGSLSWTVIFEEEPWFAASCLNRVVFVKPLPDDLPSSIGPALFSLAAIGIWPATPAEAEQASLLRPSRICPLGRMQLPPLSWHQEGRQILAPLVQWVDFEPHIG